MTVLRWPLSATSSKNDVVLSTSVKKYNLILYFIFRYLFIFLDFN